MALSKTLSRESIHTEISPLRFAPVEMTKGRGALPGTVVAGTGELVLITLGRPKAHDFLRSR
jgi:hypothetical protein